MALPYRDVLERYDRAHAFGETKSLPEYAKYLNDIYQTQDYSAGLRDGPWTRFSTRADQFLGGTVGQVTAPLGEAVGGMFGQAEAGRRVGEGLPRALLQSAPLYLAGPEAGVPATLATLAGTGALFGGQTYADTGSAKAAALSSGAAALLPVVGKYAGQLGARAFGATPRAGELAQDAFGKQAGDYWSGTIPTTGAQRTGQFLGSQLVQSAINEASGYAQQKTLNPDEPYNFLSPDFLLSQIPFTVFDAVHGATAPRITGRQADSLFKEKVVPKKEVPALTPRENTVQEQLTNEAAASAYAVIANDPAIPQEEKNAKLSALLTQINNPAAVQQAKDVVTSVTPSVQDTEITLVGYPERSGSGVLRFRIDSHDSPVPLSLRDHNTVFLEGFDEVPKVDPTTGQATVKVKISQIRNGVTHGIAPRNVSDPLQPELEQQSAGTEPVTSGLRIRGAGGSELPNYPYPELQGQPPDLSEQQITPAETETLASMGVPPERIEKLKPQNKRFKGSLFLGEGVQKSKNAILGLFQGKVLRNPQGQVRVLGGRDVPVGPVKESEFVSRTKVSPTLMPLFRQHYPEAFDAQGNIDPTVLMKGLEERPLTEVQKAGEGQGRSRNDVEHDIENLNYEFAEDDAGNVALTNEAHSKWFYPNTSQFEALPNRVRQLWQEYQTAQEGSGLSYSPHYSISSNPRGGTEIAVVAAPAKNAQGYYELLPADAHHDVPGLLGTATVEEKTLGELRATMGKDHPKLARFAGKPDDALVGVQTEAQSDWEGTRREYTENLDRWQVNKRSNENVWYVGDPQGTGNEMRRAFYSEEQARQALKTMQEGGTIDYSDIPPSHPLLPYWERLVADAVIQHGLERGWEGVVVTDAKTAAMTEGHDVGASLLGHEQFNNKEAARKKAIEVGGNLTETNGIWHVNWNIKQPVIEEFPGHAQHYGDPDFRIGPQQMPGSLQQEFAKATGEKNTMVGGGENVLAVGVHKGAGETTRGSFVTAEAAQHAAKEGERVTQAGRVFELTSQPKGSPSLTEPNPITGVVGPKVYATGNFYSFDKIRGGLELDKTLAVKELVMRYEQAETRLQNALEKLKDPLNDPIRIAELVGELTEEQRARLEKNVALAGTTRAAQTEVLIKGSTEVEAALKELEVMRKEGETITKAIDMSEAERTATALQDARRNLLALQDNEIKEVGPVRDRYNEQLEAAVDNVERLQKVADKTAGAIARKGDEALAKQTTRGKALTNEDGSDKTFATKNEAEEFRLTKTDNPEDLASFNLGRYESGPKQGQERGFILAEKKPAFASLDEIRGEGVTLHDKLTTQAEQDITEGRGSEEIHTANLPHVALEGILNAMDTMEQGPKALDAQLAKEGLTKEQWDEGRQHIESVLEGGDLDEEQTKLVAKVGKMTLWLKKLNSTQYMGSIVSKGDPEVVAKMNLHEGALGLVKWIEGLDIAGVSKLIGGYKNFPNELAKVLILHEGEGWTPGGMFYMGDELQPFINLGELPTLGTEGAIGMIMAHEITHHMTREMETRTDPAALQFKKDRKSILEALRNSPVLSKGLRNQLQRALKENHYEKFANREITDLKGLWEKQYGRPISWENYSLMYGLLNSDEMMAQMFSQPEFIQFMQATEAPKKGGFKQTVLNWFSNIWSGGMRLGEGSASAFEHMLGSYDNYLTGGILRNTYNGMDYIRDMLVRKTGVRPEALASRMDTVERTFTKGDLYHSIYGFEREGQDGTLPTTMRAGQVDQPLRTALVSGDIKDVGNAVRNLLPDQLPVHEDLFYRMQQDVEIAKNLYREVKDGKIQATIPKDSESRLKLAEVKLNRMRLELKKYGRAMERQNDLKNFTYEGLRHATGYGRLVGEPTPQPWGEPPEMELAQQLVGLRPAPQQPDLSATALRKMETSEAELEGRGASTALERGFMQTQFFEELHPVVKPVTAAVQDSQGRMFEIATKLGIARFGDADGKIDTRLVDTLERVTKDQRSGQAYNEVHLRIAEKFKEGTYNWTWDDADIKATLKGLSPKQQQDVKTLTTHDNLQHKFFVNGPLREELGNLNHLHTASVVTSLDGVLPEQGKLVSEKLYEALGMMRDPQQVQVGQQLLNEVSKMVTGPTFIAALKHANASLVDTQEFLRVASQNYDWISEQRSDKHQLRMTKPNGDTFFVSRPTKEELIKIRDEKLGDGYTSPIYTPRSEGNVPAGGLDADIYSKMQDMDTLWVTRMQEAFGGRPDSADILERVLPAVNRAQQVKASTEAFSPLPMTRKLVAGREYIDLLQNREEFYKRANNWFNHKRVTAARDLYIQHPDLAGNSVLKNWAEQHVQNYLSPDNPFVTKLNELVFYQRMGLNFGNMLLESVQSLGTGMQALIAETGSVRDAFALTAETLKELAHHFRTGEWSSAELSWFAHKAEVTGQFSPVLYNDIHDPDSNALMSISGKIGGPVKEGTQAVKGVVRGFGSFFQKFNNKISMIAAFKLAQERNGGHVNIPALEESFQFARDVKNRGTFAGGKAQRQVGMYGIKTRAVPQLMGSLQTYATGWFNQMAKDYKAGFKGAGDLTAQQRLGSRKAFVYGLAAQAVLAGGLGLPGVGQGIALLNQATGLDLKGWLRQNLSKLFDEDQDSGGLLTNLALRGAANAISPIDPSNRAAIAVPFVGVDPYKGFSLAALAGAPGSSVSDFVSGLMAAARLDEVGYQKLLPSVLKGPAQLAQGEGDVRDSRGALLQTLSPAERFFQAVGIPSSRIQNARDTADILKKQTAQAQREKEGVVDNLASLVRKGDLQQAQSQLIELKKQNPSLDVRALVHSARARFEAQNVPYDGKRNLNVGADLAGLQSRLPSTELLRRQVGDAFERSLGFQPRFDPRADLQASRVDQLLDSNHFLTKAAALQTVQGKARTLNRSVPSWLLESQ